MKEFTLTKKEPDYFKLNIGEDSFLIPLARSCTLEEADAIQTREGTLAFFRKYLGDRVFEQLTVDQLETVAGEWLKANKKAGEGESVGES